MCDVKFILVYPSRSCSAKLLEDQDPQHLPVSSHYGRQALSPRLSYLSAEVRAPAIRHLSGHDCLKQLPTSFLIHHSRLDKHVLSRDEEGMREPGYCSC